MSIRQVMSHVLEKAQYELGNYKRENKEMTTHDRDKIIAAAKEADSGFTGDESFNLGTSLVGLEAVEYFYAIAFEHGRQAEREECAKVCEHIDSLASSNPPMLCAKAIRARGYSK